MTELLLPQDKVVAVSPALEFLDKAPLFARFEWVENCGIHALVHSGKSGSRLYQIVVNSPSSEGFISNPSAKGKEIDLGAFVKYGQVRISHPSVQDFRRLSAEGLVAQLPALEVFSGRCHGFELGLAYHIRNELVSEVSLYSKRQ